MWSPYCRKHTTKTDVSVEDDAIVVVLYPVEEGGSCDDIGEVYAIRLRFRPDLSVEQIVVRGS